MANVVLRSSAEGCATCAYAINIFSHRCSILASNLVYTIYLALIKLRDKSNRGWKATFFRQSKMWKVTEKETGNFYWRFINSSRKQAFKNFTFH